MKVIVILCNIAVGLAMFLGARALRAPDLVPCFGEVYQNVVLVCASLALLNLALFPVRGHTGNAPSLAVLAIVGSLAAWLGYYPVSPLKFGAGGPGLISGFEVTRPGRHPITVDQDQTLVVTAGSILEIEPITLSGAGVACRWRSANGGSIDDPASCDIAYRPPGFRPFDVLTLAARPECGLPNSVSELKLGIAP